MGRHIALLLAGCLWLSLGVAAAAQETADATTKAFGTAVLKASLDVLPTKDESRRDMLTKDVQRQLDEANRQSAEAWERIKTKADWEQFRDEKIASLRASLHLPSEKPPLDLQTTGEIEIKSVRIVTDDGEERGQSIPVVIRKITYAGRSRVTANLFLPGKIPEKMPGILLSHSHHYSKWQNELQEMGEVWARAGCAVLVPDHVGHGERRQHPFVSGDKYPQEFNPVRQDYYFRYNTSLQLYASGESLMGWMAWDLMRGLDVLESLPNIDRERIAIFGGTAGGGDCAAVTAALDARVKLLLPMSFCEPLRSAVPSQVGYVSRGNWDSSRCLAHSAADGFLPWVIVNSVAPRDLIYCRNSNNADPIYQRSAQIFDYYHAEGRLDYVTANDFGGYATDEEPVARYGANIGRMTRPRIHANLARRWHLFDGDPKLATDGPIRRPSDTDLDCLPKDAKLTLLRELLPAEHVKLSWREALKNVEPYVPRVEEKGKRDAGPVIAERLMLGGEREIQVPLFLAYPAKRKAPVPVTVYVTNELAWSFIIRSNPDELGRRLQDSAICLVNVRGTGETRIDDDHGRTSKITSVAANQLMFGDPLLAGQLRDLRSVLAWLRTRPEFAAIEVVTDGIETNGVNAADTDFRRPLDFEQLKLANVTTPMLVLLACYFEEQPLKAHVRGGLVNYRSLLQSQFVLVPLDAIVPGAIPAGDVEELIRVGKMKHDLTVVDQVNAWNQLVVKVEKK